jgi:hypothetical protein
VWLIGWGKCYDPVGHRPSANRARAHGWGSNPRFQKRFTGTASQPTKPTWTRNQNRTSNVRVGGKGGRRNGGGTMVRGKWWRNPDGCRKAITPAEFSGCPSTHPLVFYLFIPALLLPCCRLVHLLKFLICD